MCGIAGIFNSTAPVDESLLRSMIAALRHRGPDGVGVFTDDRVGLAHARLSIIDLAGGAQPMCNEDGSVWISFNGEIFNHVELREELVKKGHRFATRSDTEVIIHLYEEEGEDCVHKLNGQWAFALWDKRRREVFLSRDRMGILPLFYTKAGGSFLWASEVKALFAHPLVDRELDLAALEETFTFWVPLPPRTIFQNVRQLPPGSSLTVKDGEVRVREYWRPDFGATIVAPTSRDEQRLGEELLELITDATRLRLRADVPVGSYLSGGLDSSLITALARNVHSGPLRSFSVTFDRCDLDESEYQHEVSAYLGTSHEALRASDEQLAAAFPEVIRHTETPVLRTAPAPLFLLSRRVRESGFKVVLTGEGSDEIFGGYDIYKENKIRRFWAAQPDSRLRPLLLKRLYPYMPSLQAQSGVYLRQFFLPADLQNPFDSHAPRWDLTTGLKLLFNERVQNELRGNDSWAVMRDAVPEQFYSWDALSRAQYLETRFLLPGYILSSQGDRMAMAHSVELRPPMLDHRVVEFALKLPARMKLKVLSEKYLLKRVASRLLPDRVVHRPKQPFRSPDGSSFFAGAAEDYVFDALSADAIKSAGLFDPAKIGTLVNKFRSGRASGTRDNMALVGVLSTQLLVRTMATTPSLNPDHGVIKFPRADQSAPVATTRC